MRFSRIRLSVFSKIPKDFKYPYQLKVGKISRVVNEPKNASLVPDLKNEHFKLLTNTDLHHLEWMLKKDAMGQDMFLIGPPGDYKRRLVNLFGYLGSKEVETVVISRDTTEADIKQKREIYNKSVVFVDQAAVRCAVNGRVLVLDGIEKAERNVLPLLNNLLENREMMLEDGRHIIPHYRYDNLLKTHGNEVMEGWKLERVHEDFRVIALGVPVPAFKGNPLDPPLRSRFQARNTIWWKKQEVVDVLKDQGVEVESNEALIDFGYSINQLKNSDKRIVQTHFVEENIIPAVVVANNNRNKIDTRRLLKSVYPFEADEQFMPPSRETRPSKKFANLTPPPLNSQSKILNEVVPCVEHSHIGRGTLLVGPQGNGKSTLASFVGQALTQRIRVVSLYKDMSIRDLLQVRSTDHLGNSIWNYSAFTNGVLNGDLMVLDGIECLHESVLFVIGRLIQTKQILLPDGVTILEANPQTKYLGIADISLKLTPEISSIFFTHSVQFEANDESTVIGGMERVKSVLALAKDFVRRGNEGDNSCAAIAKSLCIPQVKRIGSRTQDLYEQVWDVTLAEFLPPFEKQLLVDNMKAMGIVKGAAEGNLELHETPTNVTVGDKIFNKYLDDEHKPKVPNTVFFNIQSHVKVLRNLMTDFFNGDHLLLVGNQGVGKNKIVDKMLQILNIPREYIQLHRDTTVQSLTTLQRIEDGVVKTDDSPLVTAARDGLVLVIDEADKAPAHVTAVLKTLLEYGEMQLPDGRRITRKKETDKDILLHPNFRMIVLANRPGFPFLGNNFYSSLSHLFSVNPISNPGLHDEINLLTQYGPNVDQKTVVKIAKTFSELRALSDDGIISYPYSTREAVHIVKHLEAYPGDVNNAFSNVFDFDTYSDDAFEYVEKVVKKHFGEDIFLKDTGGKAIGIVELKSPQGGEGGESTPRSSEFNDPKVGKFDPTGAAHVGGNTWAGGSGGTTTAGLGGAGGPYRLTDNNPVFQVADAVKNSVPPEIREKARLMGKKAFEEKLKELEMSPYDGDVYESWLAPIRSDIQSVRRVLESLSSKSKERKWVKNQVHGDLDDSKLVEGVVGEKNIYRMRKDEKPEVGDAVTKPKLLRLLVDVSGSMYRFNGYDQRLDRMMSCVLMVCHACQGFEDVIQVEIYGHSGDDYDLKIVEHVHKLDEKERLNVLKLMFLHSQFCMSGDNTLEATQFAVKSLEAVKEEYDETFCVLISDANFDRYGITAQEYKKVIKSDDVECYAVFIGGIGGQADQLVSQMPSKAFTCFNTSQLPVILRKILVRLVDS